MAARARARDVKTPADRLARLSQEPVSCVEWLPRDWLRANDYNPNHVAPAELELLILSILADGWTQPIVCLPRTAGGTLDIVDGFHRWLVSDDPRLRARYAGLVPVTVIKADPVHRQMSTIRHNRARGQHGVVPMAKIVRGMLEAGVPVTELQQGLGMEDEEVARLADRSGMPVTGAVVPDRPTPGFGKAWTPTEGAGDRGGPAPPARTRKPQAKKSKGGRP